MVGRVARILHSNGTETRQLCSGPDIEAAQAAAIEFIRQRMRPSLPLLFLELNGAAYSDIPSMM